VQFQSRNTPESEVVMLKKIITISYFHFFQREYIKVRGNCNKFPLICNEREKYGND
jgi:hypothetical protein